MRAAAVPGCSLVDSQSLSEAPAVIYDPIRGNMLTTRAVLHAIGFRRIEGITELSALERRLKDTDIALVLVEATEEQARATALVRAIRLGETGGNPFVPMMGTLWNGQGSHVAELMNAGCDDVLLRPFSAARIEERVRWLVTNRRPFVVTSDYVGPDRGPAGEGMMPVVPFEVPNPLRAAVLKESVDPVAQSELLDRARKRVDKERLAKLARRIAMAAEVTIQARGNVAESSGFIVDLLESAAELVRASRRLALDDVQDIAIVLETVVGRTATPGPERAENAQLTRQLALALYVAYAADESEQFKSELDDTLSLVRSRLERAKERARKRLALAQSFVA